MEEISEQVEAFKTSIDDFRSEAGTKVSQITDAAAFLGDKADQYHLDLVAIDTDLDAIQVSVREYRRLTPTVILIAAFMITFFSIWAVYSQVVMISGSARRDRNQQDLADKNAESIHD